MKKEQYKKHVDTLLDAGWFLVPPEPTDEMIHAYLFEVAEGQYPHEDAGGSVMRKLKSLFTGKTEGERQYAKRRYQQAINASLTAIGRMVK
jgi:hypothetical protein